MTREDYLELRVNNSLNLIAYNYYVEKCSKSNVRMVSFREFVDKFSLWSKFNKGILGSLLTYYDIKYEVVLLEQNGKVIKIM